MGKLIYEALRKHILGVAMAALSKIKLTIRAICVIRGQMDAARAGCPYPV